MQILLQAVFAETAVEGKKPGAPILTGDGESAEMFAELLLPEMDADVEVMLDPLVIDAVPLPVPRYPRIPELPVEALVSDPVVVDTMPEIEVSEPDYEKAVLPPLQNLDGTDLVAPKLAETPVDTPAKVPPTVTAFVSDTPVPEKTPVSNIVASEKTHQSAKIAEAGPTVEKSAVSPVKPTPVSAPLTAKEGASPLVSQDKLAVEPQEDPVTRVEVQTAKPVRADVSDIPSTAPKPESLVREAVVPLERSGRIAQESDQIRAETQRLNAPVAAPAIAPVEGQVPREVQVRGDRREARGSDRQSTIRETVTATPTLTSTPTVAMAPIAQPAMPLDQRSFADGGHATIDATTGLTSRESEETRPQVTAPSRVEAAARPVMTQIVHTITRSNLEGMIEIRLSPEELGRVKLAMSQVDAGIVVHITAERPETLDLMRRNIDMLESDLRDQGFENLSFSFGQNGTQDRSEDETARNSDDAPTASGLQVEVAPVLAPIQDGRLDIRL